MTEKKNLRFFILFTWFCIIGTYISQYWLDPQLPSEILSTIQNYPTYIYGLALQYAFLVALLIASVGLWSSKKWGHFWLIGAISLLCISRLLAGPAAQYQWFAFFNDMTIISLGILVGISLSDLKPMKVNNFRYIVLGALISLISVWIAASITDSALPQSFTQFFSEHATKIPYIDNIGLISVLLSTISCIALLFTRKIVKHIFTITYILALIIMDFNNVDALTGWDAFFCSINSIFSGLLIGLLYFQPIAESKSRSSDFGNVKLILLLFLFQIGFNIIFALTLYALLPASLGHSMQGLGLIAPILGSYIFGTWIEKRRPGLLDKKRINKISLWVSIILFGFQFVAFLGYVIGHPSKFGLGPDLAIASIALPTFAFVTWIYYRLTRRFIDYGIKSRKPTV